MKKRSSNLEALRIISMYLIVMSHCDDILGIDTLYQHTIGINKIITDWLHIGGQIGVGCFVLISGYFMVDQKFTVKRILKTAGTVWFYSISIWLIWLITCVLTGRFVIKKIIIEAVFAFFPILSSHYWFATAYIILLLLAPFFNLLINAMERNQYKYLLICII